MSLDTAIRSNLVLPAVCAPMMMVSGPELVGAACKAGVMAGLPLHNARSSEEFIGWLGVISADLDRHRAAYPDAVIGPLAVNFTAKRPLSDILPDIDHCFAHGVRHFITALGNPRDIASAIHDRGGTIYHEVLGADLVYLGTRFIATQESRAPDAYKSMLVEKNSSDLSFTPRISGVAANWLLPSLERLGLDIDALMPPTRGYDHLPEDVRPWRDLWSAGQGIDLIQDIPDTATLVARLQREYVAACAIPDMAEAARARNVANA